MAALPYMPLFVADYLADTAHLTATQHGAYMLLLMNYWQRGGPLPNDDRRLASIARLGQREWARNKPILEDLFDTDARAWVHTRVDTELARVADKSLKSKRAAQASVQRRFGERSANVEPLDKIREDSEAKEASAENDVVDAETVMWQRGRQFLQNNGVSAAQAGSVLGKWKRDYGAEKTIVALGKAQREGAIDPVSFITACLGAKRRGDDYNPERITV